MPDYRVELSYWNGYNCSCCSKTWEESEHVSLEDGLTDEQVIERIKEKFPNKGDDNDNQDVENIFLIGRTIL